MKVLSIASQKGGVGKTTTAITLACGLARGQKGEDFELPPKKVLLIDIDSQANSSKVLVENYQALKKEETIYGTILQRSPLEIRPSKLPQLDIVASHILLSNTDVELTVAKDHREARLKRELDAVKDQYDYVLIDCPPALGWLTVNAFTASDQALVVVSPGYFELDSINQIGKSIQEVTDIYNPEFSLLGFLFNMSDSTLNSRNSLQVLRQTYTDYVLKAVIPRNTDLRDAHFNRQDIFGFNPQARAAYAYKKAIREIFA